MTWIKRSDFSFFLMENVAKEILSHCRFFSNITEAALEKLAAIARIKRYKKGQIIFREGAECPGVFVVGQGAVRIFKITPNGKERVLHFAYEGMTFAEVAAIGRFPCPAFADAVEDSVCALILQDDFRRTLEQDHELCLQIVTSMSSWVRYLVGILEDLMLCDATSRVARYLLRSEVSAARSQFTLPMPKKDLASHLNLTSETLSRTFRRLAECGMIAMHRQRDIRILDPAALKQIADGTPPAEFE